MKIRMSFFFIVVAFLVAGNSCQRDEFTEIQRGLSPWVFRSVLDQQARMLTAALHKNLFVAYSAETGALYKAWKGEVDLDGAVYTTAHGPQPESIGKGWTKNTIAQPWFVVAEGKRYEKPQVQYRGHRIKNGQVYIASEITVPELGRSFTVTERPEYLAGEGGQVGLERTFMISGLPAGIRLGLRVESDGLPYAQSLSTDGEWTLEETLETQSGPLTAVRVVGELLLNDTETNLTTFFVGAPLLPDDNRKENTAIVEEREPGEILIERSGCKTCHNTRVKTVGPAYIDVAERYANNSANIDKLTAKVIKGGAGAWGQAAMTAHDHLPPSDVRTMVRWVMDLDRDTEEDIVVDDSKAFSFDETEAVTPVATIAEDGLGAGLRVAIFNLPEDMGGSLTDIDWAAKPASEGIAPWINYEGADWGKLEDNFAARFSGYLKIPQTSNYLFRLRSDDGSRLVINGQEVINHDGWHGPSNKDGELALAKGNHPFFVEYFEGGGGQSLVLEWRSFFNPEWKPVPTENFGYDLSTTSATKLPPPMDRGTVYPGDGTRLAGVHPSYTLSQARPNGFAPKVGGMDFLSDGRLVISTWDAEGAVYLLDNVETGDPGKITTKKIATGLAEPLGLKVVDDTIFVMQKQELTKLIDHDGDEVIDEYRTVSNDWLTTANFHEFGFGLAYEAPFFYATLAIGILPGGASAKNQPVSRGKAVRIHRKTGALEYIASGLRTPNGINHGVDGELFIADNQGDWLPASKILHVTDGAFFNSYAVEPNETKIPKPPVVWLPQDEIGNSPSTPNILNDGPYAGQMIHGEITHGGFKRVFVERVKDEYQGTVFRFIQGLEAGVNRNVWGPDGALYVGMIGSTGNWGDAGKLFYGLQRLKYNGNPAFEMLAVRTLPDGLEVEFTQPVKQDFGQTSEGITLRRWWYEPTANYGGPKMDETELAISAMSWSTDRKKLRLSFEGMAPNRVYYLRLPKTWTDAEDRAIWTTEAWTTVNYVPERATK